VGASAASAPVHFALSAHCVAPHPRWIERSLGHYRRPDVAGAGGRRLAIGGRDLHEPFVQDMAHARADPGWGFSNHASSWRASVWAEFPFDEHLRYAEDKEWALRVLNAGWVLVFDAELFVDMSHQWRQGFFQYYRRQRDAAAALASFAEVPPFGLGELVGEWWDGPPDPRPPWRRRLNPQRAAGLLGKWRGQRRARSA
jgi:hypothetical protein